MNVDGTPYRTIWLAEDGQAVMIIDQTKLPFEFVTCRLETMADAARAIAEMWVRGAPLIGATAAYGMALAMKDDASDAGLAHAYDGLLATRPTAVNLRWALDEMKALLTPLGADARAKAAYVRAAEIADEDVAICSAIGDNGMPLIAEHWARHGKVRPVNVLTHCNAGALATGGIGTATAPMYVAHEKGLAFKVYADETRPLLQGARLTTFELQEAGIDVTLICDNMAAQVMREGKIGMVITGADRITANGDAANKIGTYGVAILAKHHGIPFYVAAPSSTFDFNLDIEQMATDLAQELREATSEAKRKKEEAELAEQQRAARKYHSALTRAPRTCSPATPASPSA